MKTPPAHNQPCWCPQCNEAFYVNGYDINKDIHIHLNRRLLYLIERHLNHAIKTVLSNSVFWNSIEVHDDIICLQILRDIIQNSLREAENRNEGQDKSAPGT